MLLRQWNFWPVACLIIGVLAAEAQAGDWPQILGPNRNGTAVDEQLPDAWPAEGPKMLWSRPVGSGFAGVAVAGGTAILFHREGDEEIVEAMDAESGKARWRSAFPARYVPTYTDDDGPRAVPVIQGSRVFVYGAMGDLRCLDLADGRSLWSRDTFEDFNSKKSPGGEPAEGFFGFGSTPLVEGPHVLVNVGGDEATAGIVAFSAADGRTAWKATDARASYSAPVAATVDGVRHVIFVTRFDVISLDPASGDVRFQFPFGRFGPTVNAASPVVFDGHLFVTASYGIGGLLARIGDSDAEVLWQEQDLMASQYTTCIEHQGCLIGIHGRQDGRKADLKCFDPASREVRWNEPFFGYATLLKAGDKLLILKSDGVLVLASADVEQYEELARAEISQSTTRALPALAEGRLYVRDSETLKCLAVGKPGP